jgi:hypothetical protein
MSETLVRELVSGNLDLILIALPIDDPEVEKVGQTWWRHGVAKTYQARRGCSYPKGRSLHGAMGHKQALFTAHDPRLLCSACGEL